MITAPLMFFWYANSKSSVDLNNTSSKDPFSVFFLDDRTVPKYAPIKPSGTVKIVGFINKLASKRLEK